MEEGKTTNRKTTQKTQTPASPNLDFIALHSKDIHSNLAISMFKAVVVSNFNCLSGMYDEKTVCGSRRTSIYISKVNCYIVVCNSLVLCSSLQI